MRDQRELQAPQAESKFRSRRVLLAEDDAAMRALLSRTLHRAGFDVVETSNGPETLEQLAHEILGEPPACLDLIISDVRMPGYDGINVLGVVQQLPHHIPVILITAFGSAAAHASAARLGAFAMLDKPFDLDELMELVRSATAPSAGDEDRS